MDNTQIKTERAERRLERIVLIVLSLYTAAAFATGLLSGWSVYIRELLFLPTLSGWFIYSREYWDHSRRANFISIACWAEFILFALFTNSFSSMLVTMAGVIVLLSIFNTQQILYPGLIVPFFLFLYHGFVARTIAVTGPRSALRLFVQFLSVYTVSAVIWIFQKNRRDANELLVDKIRELETAERSKDDFLVNISHEIRTPINAVCGMSEAILQEDLPTDVRRDVIDIQTAGRNLLSTVSNILDFSELETGSLALTEESYNITSTITDIINMALTLDNGKHLELIVDCDASLPGSLLGDEQKFRRIAMNLLGNAFKFTKEGGVILRIGSRKEAYGINLLVNVRDSGIGIKRNDMEHIFTSFRQIDSKRNREEGGIGLGLAITQALVRSMGGFMTVESEPGIGSEFQFTIPQKVLDETPIVSIRDKNDLFAACCINLEKYDYTVVREGYETCIQHIAGQLGFPFRVCRNLPELKRRMEREAYTHIFIGWEEYMEDRSFFDRLCTEKTVALFLDYDQEVPVPGNMLRIYKPFTILSIAAVFNGQKVLYGKDLRAGLHNKFIAPQANVLVVDDNAMNLKVMARLLLPYRLKVTMAGSGQEALEKLNKPNYDCVFLDHMMPEMDGVEAARIIRTECGANGRAPVIIALTANAMGGVKEMFLKNGFQDFIAKPLDRKQLNEVLSKWIPSAYKKMRKPEDKEAVLKPEIGYEDIVIDGINIKEAMKHHTGTAEEFLELLQLYCMDGKRKITFLRELLEKENYTDYGIEVHGLKSASANIGAMELSAQAREHEKAVNRGDTGFVWKHFEELLSCYDRQVSEINKYLNVRNNVTRVENQDMGASLDHNALLREIGKALDSVENFRSKECARRVEELLKYNLDSGVEAKLKEAQELLKMYEDDAVEKLLGELLDWLEKEEI